MRGKYFSTEHYEATGNALDLFAHLRIVQQGDKFQVAKGGDYKKGKLQQYDVIATCVSEKEAQDLTQKLCEIN